MRRFLISIPILILLTLGLIVLVMQPPMGDLMYLGLLLAITGIGSGLIGFLAHRSGIWQRFRRLNVALVMGYILAAGLTLLNVWVSARMMFINDHDFKLASLLLVFAGAVSVSFGFFLSDSITARLKGIVGAARELSGGDFAARVPVSGTDEVAELAEAFNQMAANLEEAEAAKQVLETARRDLVAWASHDLRTPLTSLRAMLAAISEGVVDDQETIERYMRLSQLEVSRMSDLINDLFELAQLDVGHLTLERENSSLADLVSDTLETMRARAEAKEIRLVGEVDRKVDPVWMASDKISRVLHNLLENAIRHTPVGGEVSLKAERSGDQVCISVRDTGEGVPAEAIPHVFERFFRAEQSRSRAGYDAGGTGLGLAIAKGLVEAHNGRIWLESEVGKGAVFSFVLPRQKTA